MLAAALLLAVVVPVLAGRSMPGNGHRTGNNRAVSVAEKKDVPDSAANPLSRNDRRRYSYFFLEAVRQQNAGHFDAAFDLLEHCRQIDPNAAEVYYLRALYYAELDSNALALENLERAAALSPGNDMYQERVAQYNIGNNNYDRAISAYERLYRHHPERTDVLNVLAYLYRHQKNYREVLRCLDRIEEVDGPSEETTLSKLQTYEQKGDRKMAYQTLKTLADTHPNDVNYRLMLGNWLMQNSREADAFKLFTQALKDDPDNEYALSSMYDYYRQAGNDTLARQLRDRILVSQKVSTDTKVQLLRQVIDDSEKAGGDSVPVLALMQRMQQVCPKETNLSMFQVAYMELKKMPQPQIDSLLYHIIKETPDNVPACVKLLQALWKQQQWDRIVTLSRQSTQYNPEEMVFYYFLGMAYYQKEDNDKALDAFRRGVGEINKQSDPAIVSDFYALMGDILHQKGLNAEAYAAYDSCLQWKADNMSCLNNYAYFLSIDNGDLSKAEAMSYKTVKAEPANATYLDTYAWILFRQKRYDEAKTYIDMAVKNDTDTTASATVIEHAGDIYAMTGHTDQAVLYWKRAIERGGDKALLGKKIRLKKYVEK